MTSVSPVLQGHRRRHRELHFYLQTDRGAFILTLYEKRVAADDLPFSLGLMEHLAQQGVHCPLPVKTRDGRALVSAPIAATPPSSPS